MGSGDRYRRQLTLRQLSPELRSGLTPKVCFYPATNSDSVSTNSRYRLNQRRGNCASSTSSRSPVGAVNSIDEIRTLPPVNEFGFAA